MADADTQLKRFGMINLGSPFVRVLPPPAGSVGAGQRAVLLSLYPLGAAGSEGDPQEPPQDPGEGSFILIRRRKRGGKGRR